MESKTINSLFDFYENFTSDLCCILDINFKFLKANSAFYQTLNCTTKEILDNSILSFVLEADVEDVKDQLKNALHHIQEFKFHLLSKDKTTVPVLWSCKFDDEANRYVLIGKNIQVLDRTISKRLGVITNAVSDGFFILNKKWEVIYYNKSAYKSVVHPDITLNANGGFWDLFPKAIDTKFYTQFSKAFTEQVPVNFVEYSPTLNKWFKIDAIPFGDELNVISKDISEQIIEEKTNELELDIFELNAQGKNSLEDLMNTLLIGLEELYPNIYSSLLRIENNRVYHIASPRLPDEYIKVLNGSLIGPKAGSCGTSAFLRKQIIVEDISTDPLWEDYKDFILPHGFKSCWSSPIISNKDKTVMATYAIYYKERKKPSTAELKTISRITQTIKVLLEDIKHNEAILISNNRYAMVSMATNDAIYDWDLVKNQTYWNDNVYELFGYTLNEIAHETKWWEHHIHPEDRPAILASSDATIAAKKSIWTAEYRFLCKNGSYKYVYERSFIIYDKTGTVVTIIGAIHDINDLKEKEIFVSKQNDKLKEIAQISSHDLRGPVTSILGLINLFNKENPADPFNAEVIAYLEYATKQLDEVIHTIVAKTLEADHTIYFKNKALAFKANEVKQEV